MWLKRRETPARDWPEIRPVPCPVRLAIWPSCCDSKPDSNEWARPAGFTGRSVRGSYAARESRSKPRWRTASALWERAAIRGWNPGHGGHFRDVLRRRKLDWCQGGQPNSPDRGSHVGHLRSESARALAFGLPQTPACQPCARTRRKPETSRSAQITKKPALRSRRLCEWPVQAAGAALSRYSLRGHPDLCNCGHHHLVVCADYLEVSVDEDVVGAS
jgi:hypothetical protein